MLGKSYFAQGVKWSPQNNPAVSYLAWKKVALTGDHLFVHFSSFYTKY